MHFFAYIPYVSSDKLKILFYRDPCEMINIFLLPGKHKTFCRSYRHLSKVGVTSKKALILR